MSRGHWLNTYHFYTVLANQLHFTQQTSSNPASYFNRPDNDRWSFKSDKTENCTRIITFFREPPQFQNSRKNPTGTELHPTTQTHSGVEANDRTIESITWQVEVLGRGRTSTEVSSRWARGPRTLIDWNNSTSESGWELLREEDSSTRTPKTSARHSLATSRPSTSTPGAGSTVPNHQSQQKKKQGERIKREGSRHNNGMFMAKGIRNQRRGSGGRKWRCDVRFGNPSLILPPSEWIPSVSFK